jgi:hypothetical protein
MAATRFSLRVIPDVGEPVEVIAGQREIAAWEREPFGCALTLVEGKAPVLFFRYLAYAALKRTGRLLTPGTATPSFDAWSADIDEVEDVEGEAEPVDPTTPGRPLAG